MLEYVTRAVVLEKSPAGDFDGIVSLYTEDFGRVSAKATSIRKIPSNLSAHLEPGNLATVRLVARRSPLISGGLRLVDGLSERKLFSDYLFLDIVSRMTVELHKDEGLWRFLLSGATDRPALFSHLGFGTPARGCTCCGAESAFFHETDQVFLCAPCSFSVPQSFLLHI